MAWKSEKQETNELKEKINRLEKENKALKLEIEKIKTNE